MTPDPSTEARLRESLKKIDWLYRSNRQLGEPWQKVAQRMRDEALAALASPPPAPDASPLHTTALNGESLYRVWWQAAWDSMDNPPQWEQLSKGQRGVWAETARRLVRSQTQSADLPRSGEPSDE
jgi:hypothetical protein